MAVASGVAEDMSQSLLSSPTSEGYRTAQVSPVPSPTPARIATTLDHSDEDTADVCAICLSEGGSPRAPLVPLVCSHVFHGECIAAWAARHDSCPTCRHPGIGVPDVRIDIPDAEGPGMCTCDRTSQTLCFAVGFLSVAMLIDGIYLYSLLREDDARL
jgi:hypothetical protein